MPTIRNPVLTVEAVAGHPGQRRLRVDYELACSPSDPAVDRAVSERITIHAVDEHDAPVQPRRRAILDADETFVATVGTRHRSFERIVHRVDLDVEQDWWSADHGGRPDPIAEWLDHIVADISLHVAGRLAAEATTPSVTGSWGALGSD